MPDMTDADRKAFERWWVDDGWEEYLGHVVGAHTCADRAWQAALAHDRAHPDKWQQGYLCGIEDEQHNSVHAERERQMMAVIERCTEFCLDMQAFFESKARRSNDLDTLIADIAALKGGK